MTPRARRLISWASIIAFVIAAPAVILSTAGYRYNRANGKIERTGVLIVDSRPTGASIFLNGAERSEKTPSDVIRLLPGDYVVRLEKSGYRPWEKEVEIGTDQTTFVSGVALFRDELPLLEQEASATTTAFSGDGRRLAVFTHADRWNEVRVFDLKTGASWLPYRAPGNDAQPSFDWSPDARRLLITMPGPQQPTFLVWDTGAPQSLLAIDEIAARPFRQAFWSEDGQTLYAADKTTLYALDLTTRESSAQGPAADGMTVDGGTVFGFMDGPDGTALVRRLPKESTFSEEAVVPKAAYRRVSGSGRLLAFSSPSGNLLLVDPADTKKDPVTLDGRAGVWSADGRTLMYWNDFELHLYDAEQGTDDLLTRISSPLRRARWYADGRHVLYASDAGVWVADTDGNDGTPTRLAAFSGLTDFSVDAAGAEATLVGSIGRQSGIWSLKLK